MDPAMMGAPPMDPAMMGMDPAMMGMDPAAMGAGADPLADPAAGGAPEEMSPDTPVQMTLEDLRSIFTEIVTGEPAEPSEPEGPQDVESRLANIEDMLSQLVGGPEMAPPGAPPAGPDPMAGAPPELTEAPGEPAQNMAPGMEGFAPEVQKMASYEERMSAAHWDERNRIIQLLAKLHRAQ
jgi:hypothetical protein